MCQIAPLRRAVISSSPTCPDSTRVSSHHVGTICQEVEFGLSFVGGRIVGHHRRWIVEANAHGEQVGRNIAGLESYTTP